MTQRSNLVEYPAWILNTLESARQATETNNEVRRRSLLVEGIWWAVLDSNQRPIG